MKNLLAILILSIFFLFACNNTPTTPSTSKELFPLKTNNQWNYRVTFYDSNDSIINQITDVWTIVADTTILNERAYIIESSNNKKNGLPNNVLFARNDGIYRLSDDWKANLLYKFPVTQGDTYLVDSDTMKIGMTDLTMYLGEKHYNCIEYLKDNVRNNTATNTITYMSAGVGVVYSSARFFDNGKFSGEVSSELVSYSLK